MPTPRCPMVLALVAVVASTGHARADQIDRIMVADAAAIFKAVQSLKAKNVAVLPFQVKFGDAPASFACGSIGVEMLNRMENLLVLTLNPKEPEFTLLAKSSESVSVLVKETNTSLDWSTIEGRTKLLELNLPVLWAEREQRTPDVFVTGTVLVAKNYEELKIELVAFSRADVVKKFGVLVGSTVGRQSRGIRVDRSMLASLGLSFSTSRKLKPTGQVRDLTAGDESAISDATQRADPANPVTAVGPVKFEFVLDGTSVPLEADDVSRGGYKATLPTTPRAACQSVAFRVENTSTEKLAVLLCLDGKNIISVDEESLDSHEKPRFRFRMFLLEPGSKYEIPGILTNPKTGALEPFVLTPSVADEGALRTKRPDNCGKIQMFVFGRAPLPTPNILGPEATAADEEETRIDEAEDLSYMATHYRSLGKFRDLATTQRGLFAYTKLQLKSGKLQQKWRPNLPPHPPFRDAEGEVIKFQYDSLPLDSLQITYAAP